MPHFDHSPRPGEIDPHIHISEWEGGDKSTSLFLFHLCLSSSTLVAEHIGRAGGSILQNISMIIPMIIIIQGIAKYINNHHDRHEHFRHYSGILPVHYNQHPDMIYVKK